MPEAVPPSAAPAPAPAAPPTTAPVVPPPVPAPDAGVSDSLPYHPSQDDAAGLAAYRAARAATKAAAPEAAPPDPKPSEPGGGLVPGSPTATTPTTTEPSPEADLSPEDAKLARVLNRISRLEDERNAARAAAAERDTELAKLRERAKFADDYERDLAEFHDDPERLFKRVKWDQAKIQDYVVNGPSKVDAVTERVSRETAELKARLERFERAEAERTQANRIADFKATLPTQLQEKKDAYPHVLAFYENPSELADALFGIMESTYRSQNGKELTVDETAKVLETTLSGYYERLSRARSQNPPVADPTAPSRTTKPSSAPTLTNTPPVASKPPTPAEEDDDSLLASAASFLRTRRTAAA